MKYAFTALNLICIAAIAYGGVNLMYKRVLPETPPDGGAVLATPPAGPQTIADTRRTPGGTDRQTGVILKRNLFRVEVEETKAAKAPEPEQTSPDDIESLEPTQLKISLWGTVTGGSLVYAVIEDKKQRRQDLYMVNDTIQEARVVQILRNKVVLNYQRKNQLLDMESKTRP